MNEERMKALFLLSGFEIEQSYKLANEYWPDCEDYADIRRDSPWWLVKTEYGMIKIGWRKRVIDIDWSDTEYRAGESKFWDGRDIDGIVKNEVMVTKGRMHIHAWGYAKAVEYLTILHLRLRQVASTGDLI